MVFKLPFPGNGIFENIGFGKGPLARTTYKASRLTCFLLSAIALFTLQSLSLQITFAKSCKRNNRPKTYFMSS